MRLYQVDLESDTFTDKTYSENVPGYKISLGKVKSIPELYGYDF